MMINTEVLNLIAYYTKTFTVNDVLDAVATVTEPHHRLSVGYFHE